MILVAMNHFTAVLIAYIYFLKMVHMELYLTTQTEKHKKNINSRVCRLINILASTDETSGKYKNHSGNCIPAGNSIRNFCIAGALAIRFYKYCIYSIRISHCLCAALDAPNRTTPTYPFFFSKPNTQPFSLGIDGDCFTGDVKIFCTMDARRAAQLPGCRYVAHYQNHVRTVFGGRLVTCI